MAELKKLRAQCAEAEASLAELQLRHAQQGTFLKDLTAAAADERMATADETGMLKAELNESRSRVLSAVAAAHASATSATEATSALHRNHFIEKERVGNYERQLTALSTQLQLHRNATATAAGSVVELQGRLRKLQSSSTEAIERAEEALKELKSSSTEAIARAEEALKELKESSALANARINAAEARCKVAEDGHAETLRLLGTEMGPAHRKRKTLSAVSSAEDLQQMSPDVTGTS